MDNTSGLDEAATKSFESIEAQYIEHQCMSTEDSDFHQLRLHQPEKSFSAPRGVLLEPNDIDVVRGGIIVAVEIRRGGIEGASVLPTMGFGMGIGE
jgi:hypothetical protein